MIAELVKATLALATAAIIPGYFWSRCFLGNLDLIQRFTYSIVLSIIFVPSVALLLTRIVGGGLSLGEAVAAPVIVFCTGIAAYWRLHSGAEKSEPAEPASTRISSFAMIPVILACVFALLLAFGKVALGARSIELLMLICAATVAIQIGLVSTDRLKRFWPGQLLTVESINKLSILRYPALLLIAGLTLYRAYSGPVRYDWPYIRGVDQYSHSILTQLVMSRGTGASFMLYPPGFHFLSATLARISGLAPLDLFAVLAPAMLLLPVLACYTLARQIWGWEYGIGAAAVVGLLVNGPYGYFNDAMYPNLVGAEFLLVLVISALLYLLLQPSARRGLLLALVGGGIVLYHQVATLYLIAYLAITCAILVPYFVFRDRRRTVYTISSLLVMGVLALVYAWNAYKLPSLVSALLNHSSDNSVVKASRMAVGSQLPYGHEFSVKLLSVGAVALAVLGLFLLVFEYRRDVYVNWIPKILLVVWLAVMLVGSRLPQTGFPQRFDRDLSIPVAVLGGYALVRIVRSVRLRMPLTALGATIAIALVVVQGSLSVRADNTPSTQLLLTPDMVAAGKWLRKHNNGGTIFVSPHVHQVPSRAMLAMSGYTRWQSYAPWQLNVRRDLPESGAGPLKDVLWVMWHPEGPNTMHILQSRDVHYIVLYKTFPRHTLWDRKLEYDWRPFEELPGLYQVVFENPGMLIVKPLATSAPAAAG